MCGVHPGKEIPWRIIFLKKDFLRKGILRRKEVPRKDSLDKCTAEEGIIKARRPPERLSYTILFFNLSACVSLRLSETEKTLKPLSWLRPWMILYDWTSPVWIQSRSRQGDWMRRTWESELHSIRKKLLSRQLDPITRNFYCEDIFDFSRRESQIKIDFLSVH